VLSVPLLKRIPLIGQLVNGWQHLAKQHDHIDDDETKERKTVDLVPDELTQQGFSLSLKYTLAPS
jgi:hypothetical protein